MQLAPDFKPMNVGLRKRLSFSAIRTKHKPSLDMLACVKNNSRIDIAEKTPLSARRHLDEITKNKQGRIVNFRNERKKTNLKQHDRSILKHK